jgi:hypothetical protein
MVSRKVPKELAQIYNDLLSGAKKATIWMLSILTNLRFVLGLDMPSNSSNILHLWSRTLGNRGLERS